MPEAMTDSDKQGSGGVRLLSLLGACVACCLPMLILLGAVSIGAALAGLVGLAVLVAFVATAVVIARRPTTTRRRNRPSANLRLRVVVGTSSGYVAIVCT